jgi:cytochrome c553
MLRTARTLAILSLTTIVSSPALAQPAVPGFVRFYQDDKEKASEGGQLLITTLKCRQCHQPQKGEVNAQSAPILDDVGSRVKRSYLREFLSDPHKAKPGTTMPNLFAGLDEADKKAKVEALVHHLASTGAPAQSRPDGKAINAGRDLYHKVGCVACHGTRDAKGEQDKLFPTSVPLGDLNVKYSLGGLKTFLENPHQTRPHGRMPGLLNPKEASDVANYLVQKATGGAAVLNLNYSYYEGAWNSVPDFAKLKPVATGQANDFDLGVARRSNNSGLKFEGFLKIDKDGTYTFHTTSDDGSLLWINDKVVVNNDGVHPPTSKSGKVKLTKGMHKLTVGVFNAGGGFELSCEIEGAGLGRQPLGPLVYRTEKFEVAPDPKKGGTPFVVDADLAAKGKELFVSVGCANCHQLQGEKKRSDTIALENLKGVGGCLGDAPKKGVPWYGLSAAQKSALQARLKKAPAADDKAKVAHTLVQHNCYACHERDKIGGVEDDMKKHFTATFKEWGDEASIPPSLTGVGAKLNPAYFKKILEQGAHDRGYMNTRMPKFGAGVTHIVDALGKLDGEVDKSPKAAFADPMTKVKASGRHMVGRQAFGCINCHNFGGIKTEGVQGIDMAIMTERLKKDWFHAYLRDPSKFRPGTRMPTSFPDGKSPLKKVLDGDANLQIEAMWVYLADGKAATIPVGMNKASIPLIPTNEAIIYRNFIQGAGTRGIGVGYPERAHLAFDANDLRLAMIWQGLFMDARRHWTGRGEGFEPPMGDNILNLPAGVGFYILAKDDEAWPTKPAKELGYKFKGYRLSDDQRPTFSYTFNGITIDDFPNAVESKGNPQIRRTLTLTTENPIDRLYYRAAVADKIEVDKQGYYVLGTWRMRIESDANPVIRKAGNKMELLVPVRFKGNSATIVQE